MPVLTETPSLSPQLALAAQKLHLREGELRSAMHAVGPAHDDHLP